MLPETVELFLEYLVTAAGLSVIVVFVTQFAKERLNLESTWALVLAAASAAVVGVGATLLIDYELYVYAEKWWPLVLALVAAVFGGSQILYRKLPTRDNVDGA